MKRAFYSDFLSGGCVYTWELTDFTRLSDRTISDGSPFYSALTIAEAVDRLESNFGVIVLFCVFWILGTGFVVFTFYQRENDWLE